MYWLWGVTLLWAFSFSLIGEYLAGQVDSYFAVVTRIALACVVFLPWLLRRTTSLRLALPLMLIGALQLGLMYCFYYQSFLLLSVPEVLVFTIFTPVYITLLHDLIAKQFHTAYLIGAVLAVAGAAIMRWQNLSSDFWLGFFIVQGANLCFAIGQVWYKWLLLQPHFRNTAQHQVFGWFYVGALCVALPAWGILGNSQLPTTTLHWGILLWLGVVASGFGFFAWNKGATYVSSGQLAIMNNAVIPLGLLVNLILFNRDTDMLRLSLGGIVLLAALVVVNYSRRTNKLNEPALR